MSRTAKGIGDKSGVKGFFRLNIVEKKDGRDVVVGDSGWKENLITNNGFDMYICRSIGSVSGSLYVSRMMLGTGGAPAATDTALAGELNTATYTRTTVTVTVTSSKTARFTATWASSSSHITVSYPLSNIGLINNTTSAGSLMAGNTYTSSAWNTNQDINATYEIRFS